MKNSVAYLETSVCPGRVLSMEVKARSQAQASAAQTSLIMRMVGGPVKVLIPGLSVTYCISPHRG